MNIMEEEMIIEHYEVFRTKLRSAELNQENWDLLRTESSEYAYAIEDTIEQYEENCRKAVSYEASAIHIIEILKKYGYKHIVTLGAGKGILEWHLKKQMPDLYVECTDYAKSAVDKLKKVFTECNKLHSFDMLKGDYRIFKDEAVFLLYRVSEELCYEDWCNVFKKMREEGVRMIIYIPDMLATKELEEKLNSRHQRNRERGIADTFCGWIYSEDTLEEMFRAGNYKIAEKYPDGDMMMYILKC